MSRVSFDGDIMLGSLNRQTYTSCCHFDVQHYHSRLVPAW